MAALLESGIRKDKNRLTRLNRTIDFFSRSIGGSVAVHIYYIKEEMLCFTPTFKHIYTP